MGQALPVCITEAAQADVERGGHMQQIGLESAQLALNRGHAGESKPALRIEKKRDAGNRPDRIGVAVLGGGFRREQQMLNPPAVQVAG
ncbi:hypothetical protein D3C75_1040520 [compost metagenome]